MVKTAASILRIVGVIYLVLGIIAGIVIMITRAPSAGFPLVLGSIVGALLLITFAELAINVAGMRNSVAHYVEAKCPQRLSKRGAGGEGNFPGEEWECSECGATVSAAARICPQCGADISEIENEETQV